jgi:TonB family protein
MSYIYEPEIEEEDEGYSIPKILVAVLLLILLGVGGYVMWQSNTIKKKFQSLESQKKEVENELDEMILKYNLAIDDNGSLSGELSEERDRIIRFRDSIKKIKGNENICIEDYNRAIKSLKDNSALVFDEPSKKTSTSGAENSSSSNNSKGDETKVELKNPTATDTKTDQVAAKEEVKDNPATKTENSTVESKAVSANDTEIKSFERVEIPPTYPGCTGDIVQKKACFNQKVRSALVKKFDMTLASDLNLSSGTQRIMVNFTVDKFGNVTNITAKGSHPKMEAEAVKAAKSLPKMTAARQNGVPVDVVFNVPITFVVE